MKGKVMSGTKTSSRPKVMKSKSTVAFYDPKNKKWTTVIEDITSIKFPFSVIFGVTPEWAQRVLDERNTDNRRLSPHRIDSYARSIIAGKWKVNNDDICFDKDGILLNGQHRLAAVVKAKMTIKMSFKFGLNDDIIPTIDEGKRRTNLDVMRLMKEPGTNKTLSATNYVMEQTGKRSRMPREEQLAFHRRHYDAATFACQLTTKPFARNPVHAALLRAYYHVDSERLNKFIYILNSGVWDGHPANNAAFRLRRYIEAHRHGHTGTARCELYQKTESAVKHFCDRTPIKRLYVASDELFPLPEEQIKV